MTDANGSRNIKPGSPSAGNLPPGSLPNQASHGLSSSRAIEGSGHDYKQIERPRLGILSLSGVPKAGTKAGTETGAVNAAGSSADSPRSRHRATTDKTSRRDRRTRHSSASSNKNAEWRRLFGTVPDRVKRKSSSRTRALKAKTLSPTEKSSDSRTGGRPSDRAGGRAGGRPSTRSNNRPDNKPVRGSLGGALPSLKSASSSTALPRKGTASTADKKRPDLPGTGHPGRVPPSRNLVRKRRRASRKFALLQRGIQLLIVGLGVAAIGGTLLKMRPEDPAVAIVSETIAPSAKPAAKSFPLTLTQEMSALKASLQELPNLYPGLIPKVFYIDIDTGQYVSVEGAETVAAASTIKLPILLAFFEEVDAGRIDPNQTLEIQETQIAEGSGNLQILAPGTQFTALEVASQMIINSDNTATNMMIDLLGGSESLNNRFKAAGLQKTVLNSPLPDLEGTNTTSAQDLVHVMLLISQGDSLSMRSRDRVLNILNRTDNKDLLAAGPQEKGALTYNKTGDIGSVLGDVALVDLPNGKRYAIAALVERPTNDNRAPEMIRRISGLSYQEADQAIQRAITPPDNDEGNSEGTSASPTTPNSSDPSSSPANSGPANSGPASSDSPEGTSGARNSRTPVSDAANVPETEPYPSANPRRP